MNNLVSINIKFKNSINYIELKLELNKKILLVN